MNQLDSSKESLVSIRLFKWSATCYDRINKVGKLYDYADGYHAALNQFNKDEKDAEIYKLFHQTLDLLDESDKNYNDLLETVGTPKNGN